ncbi:MAG: YggT family protein [Deltaproteobacteria bacterium]|nr:YggT family protein [Deltaproteobacteria bacterium]
MFLLANLLGALATVLDYLLMIYMYVIIARAVISWVNPDPYNSIVRFLYIVTDPVLDRVRRLFPFSAGGIDFSPIIVFIAIIFLQQFLVQSLKDLARSLS